MASTTLRGQLVDVIANRIFPAEITLEKGLITAIRELEPGTLPANAAFILPGLIDAHVHVESSMLLPSEFARMAVCHGTIASVSDPHEIANVLGIEGVRYMVRNGKKVPFKFWFGAPSCVPATGFETAGASLDAAAVKELLEVDGLPYLAEMMNFPGVLQRDPEVMSKIQAAQKLGKPIDGHAPGLMGDQARQYALAGINTDHECVSLEEALHKISCGMNILIREGSAARNFDALASLLDTHPEKVMLCSDDKHPNDLEVGHINRLLSRAVARGTDPLDAIRAASLNPVAHYGIPAGLLQAGDPADLILVDNLNDFNVSATYIDGELVAADGEPKIKPVTEPEINRFAAEPVEAEDLRLPRTSDRVRSIQVHDGQLLTTEKIVDLPDSDSRFVEASEALDLAKLVVVNRYSPAPPAVAFVSGFGLKRGALASTVAHDSHNIIAVGMDDRSLALAINAIVKSGGGLSLADTGQIETLPLPVAGLLSTDDGWAVASRYDAIDRRSRELGSPLGAPFMTLSFLALLVIPELKLSDKGLFDGRKFEFTSVCC